MNLREEREEKCRLGYKPRVHCLLLEAFPEGPMAPFFILLMPCFYDLKTIVTSAPALEEMPPTVFGTEPGSGRCGIQIRVSQFSTRKTT